MSRAQDILQRVDEIAPRRRIGVRQRRVQTIVRCPPFYKLVGTACIQDTPQEARRLSVRHKRAWRFSTRKKLGKLLLKRHQSLALRASAFGPQTHAVHKPGQEEFFAVPRHARALKRLLASRMSQQQAVQTQQVTQPQVTTAKGGKSLAAQVSIPTTVPMSQGPTAGKV